MRPASIRKFEWVVIVSVLLVILNSLLVRDQAVAAVEQAGGSAGMLWVIQGIVIGITLLLLYFISRRGSPVAKWIFVVLTVVGLVMGLAGIQQALAYGTLPMLLTVAQYALQIAALWLLFRPDSNAYFAEGRADIDLDSLR